MSPLDRILPLDRSRLRAMHAAPPGALRDYLAVPFPRRRADLGEVGFLAVDLETTGLEPARDEIVSAAWVALDARAVDLSTARLRFAAPEGAMPETSAVIHGIGDDAAARGSPLRSVLEELLAALAGKVLVAHNAPFEIAMIDAACRRVLGGRFVARSVDTLALARKALEARGEAAYPEAGANLRLDAVRRAHNLPRYRAHDALSDAVAAAELFLAQVAERESGRGLKLASVLARP